MKYYIVGVDSASGSHNNDSPDLLTYYELGWEIMTTHIEVKELFHHKIVTDEDYIVTCSGREFLYKKTFKNVITWEYFNRLNVPNDNVVNLCKKYLGNMTLLENLKFKNSEDFLKILMSFEFENSIFNYDLSNKFVCLVYRNRSHCPERNIDIYFFKNLISYLVDKKFKVFVVGYGAEMFQDDNNCFHVTLNQFNSLIGNDNCELCISTLTGPPHLTYFFGGKNLKNIIIDLDSARSNPASQNHPLAMGDTFNYKKIPTNFIFGKVNETDLFKIIDDKIKHYGFNRF